MNWHLTAALILLAAGLTGLVIVAFKLARNR